MGLPSALVLPGGGLGGVSQCVLIWGKPMGEFEVGVY
jgi:hypothetical protein